MSRFNTGNPIDSADPRDLSDNAKNLDQGINSNDPTFTDRLGNSRQSWAGMELEFQAAQDDKQDRFSTFIASSGYQFVGDYDTGIELTEYNQVVRDTNGEFWRVSSATELPYTTTGAGLPEGGAFVTVGDAALRQDLDGDVANGQGARLVRGAVIYVDTIADLLALDTSGLVGGQQVQVKEYHADTGVGGGEFYWDATSTEDENGGTVFGDNAQGRWLRRKSGSISPFDFGARESEIYPANDPLTAFFDHARGNQSQYGSSQQMPSCVGRFYIETPFEINLIRTSIYFDCQLITKNESDIGIELRAFAGSSYGQLSVVCGPTSSTMEDYNQRRQKIGAVLKQVRTANLPDIRVEGTLYGGVSVEGFSSEAQTNSNMATLHKLNTVATGNRDIFDTPILGISNTGSPASSTQRSVVTLDTVPEHLQEFDFLEFDGQVLQVESVNHASGEVTCFPQATDESYSGFAKCFVGFGVRVIGNDANAVGIGLIDSVGCGTALRSQAMYGQFVQRLHCATTGVGVYVQGATNNGGCIGYYYKEAGGYEIVERGNARNWNILTWSRAFRSPNHYSLQPIGSSIFGAKRINAQDYSEFGQPTLTDLFFRGYEHMGVRQNNLPIATGNYILLCKYEGGRQYISGELHGKRTAASSLGRRATRVSLSVSGRLAGPPAVAWTAMSHSDESRIVTLDYDGETYIALDNTANNASELFFAGWHNESVFETVSAGDVSDVSLLTTDVHMEFGGAFRYHPGGHLIPSVDNETTLGSSSFRWSEIYAANGTINTSDAREKQHIVALSDAERACAQKLKKMICKFKWMHAVEEKGAGARWHFGVMAQEVKQVFESHGLDAHEYGLFCYDEWYEGPEVIDEETGEAIEQAPNRDRYGVRYDQLLAFIISAI